MSVMRSSVQSELFTFGQTASRSSVLSERHLFTFGQTAGRSSVLSESCLPLVKLLGEAVF